MQHSDCRIVENSHRHNLKRGIKQAKAASQRSIFSKKGRVWQCIQYIPNYSVNPATPLQTAVPTRLRSSITPLRILELLRVIMGPSPQVLLLLLMLLTPL